MGREVESVCALGEAQAEEATALFDLTFTDCPLTMRRRRRRRRRRPFGIVVVAGVGRTGVRLCLSVCVCTLTSKYTQSPSPSLSLPLCMHLWQLFSAQKFHLLSIWKYLHTLKILKCLES